jgi:hypothetical protein
VIQVNGAASGICVVPTGRAKRPLTLVKVPLSSSPLTLSLAAGMRVERHPRLVPPRWPGVSYVTFAAILAGYGARRQP